VDYIRPMLNFDSLDDLKSAIATDIEDSHRILDSNLLSRYKSHDFFREANK